MHRNFGVRPLTLLAGLAFALGCGDNGGGPVEPPPPDPASMEKTGGDGQLAAAGTAVAVVPTVRVLDENNAAAPNVTVTFAVTGGGGTITGATATTSATGHASVGSWTLGAGGGNNSLTATVEGLPPETFTATGQIASGTPASVVAFIGGGQTAQVGIPIPVSPTVLVTDDVGDPVQFATVTFSVQGGGGSLTGATATTDENGHAKPDAWRLGPLPGINSLRATVAGLTPVDFTATGRAIDPAGFNLTLRFVSVVTPAQYAVFEEARERWEEVITGELSDIAVPGQAVCTGTDPINETIDDVVIFVNLKEIDGPGSVLGSAGPCAIRNSNGLPVSGQMNFDTDDLGAMSPTLFRDVILHEMGHVIGVGSLWNTTTPLRTLLTGAQSDDPYFVGGGAIGAFDAAGGIAYVGNKVPVENTGGAGTRDSHWRETSLQNELMTGFISGVTANPLSAITIASLSDMGYVVNPSVADDYTWSATVRMNAGDLPLVEEPLTDPILIFSESGRVTGSIQRP